MKTSILLVLATVLCSSIAIAQETIRYHSVAYPAKNPLISFSVAEGWKSQMKGSSLFVVSPDGGDVIVEVSMMQAALNDDAAAYDEAKSTVDQDFKNLALEKGPNGENKGVKVSMLNGKGKDKSGEAAIALIMVKNPAAKNQVLVSIITSADAHKKYGEQLLGIMGTIGAAGPGGEPAAAGGQSIGYPAKSPLLTFNVPEDWTAKTKGSSLFVLSPDGGEVIVEVMDLKAGADNDAAAIKEAEATVDQDFKKLNFTAGQSVKSNGLQIGTLTSKGVDKHGEALINFMLIKHPAVTHQILVSVISSKKGSEKYQDAMFGILTSLAATGKPVAAAAPSGKNVQTFSYPSKAKPDFTIDFPADWKMETTAEGAYVESPDKLIPFNVIMIDASNVGVALESMKKKIGSAYSKIVWNEGKAPQVLKDADLGLTATFENGQAMDGKDPYVVNFVQYVKKGGGKFLLMFAQYPKAALARHADNLEAVIKSIKVR